MERAEKRAGQPARYRCLDCTLRDYCIPCLQSTEYSGRGPSPGATKFRGAPSYALPSARVPLCKAMQSQVGHTPPTPVLAPTVRARDNHPIPGTSRYPYTTDGIRLLISPIRVCGCAADSTMVDGIMSLASNIESVSNYL